MKNESIDNICVETSQPTRTGRGSFWQNLKNYLPPSSGKAGTLTWGWGWTWVRRRYCGFIGGAWLELWDSTQSYFIAHNEIWRPVLLAALCRRREGRGYQVMELQIWNITTLLSPPAVSDFLVGWPGQDLDTKSSQRHSLISPSKVQWTFFVSELCGFVSSRSISVSTLMRSAYFN